MKQAIGEYLHAYVPEKLAASQTQEMMPLQNLVKQDAVKECTESEAKDKGAGPQ
jgi:hypothetical protein